MIKTLVGLTLVFLIIMPGMPQDQGKRQLSLEQAIDEALKKNLDLQIEMTNPEIYQALLSKSNSIFIPRLSLDSSYSNSTTATTSRIEGGDIVATDQRKLNASLSQTIALGGTFQAAWNNSRTSSNSTWSTLNPSYSSNLRFSLTQPLLKNFGTFVTKRSIYVAQNNEKKSLLTLEQRIIDLIYQVEEAYWNLVYAYRNLEIQAKSLALARDQLRQNEIQVKVGVSAQMDILTAKAEVASRESQLLQAQNLIQTYEENLRRILNISQVKEQVIPIDQPSFERITVDFEKLLSEAREKRPDIQQARLDLKNKNIDVKYTRNQLLPDLSLTASYQTAGVAGTKLKTETNPEIIIPFKDALKDLMARLYPIYSVQLQLGIPLKNDSARADYAQALLSLKQMLLQLQKTESTIYSDVRLIFRDIEGKAKIIEASRFSRELQEEKLKAEQKKFEVGLSTNYLILQFQRDLAQQLIAELQAIINYKLATAKLNQVVGNSLDKHNLQLAEFDKTKK